MIERRIIFGFQKIIFGSENFEREYEGTENFEREYEGKKLGEKV